MMQTELKIDFHTHILPKIDDGADSLETSSKMLQMLFQQQVSHIVLTPHYYSHHKPIDEFVKKRSTALQQLKSVVTPTRLHIGAEVYFTDYLFNNDDLSPLCINNGNVLLLELPYDKTIDENLLDKVDRLISEFSVIPVIAHIERYPSLIRNIDSLDRLINAGCVLQVNLSSFATWGRRRLISLAKDGYIGALGTDAHNLTSRLPDYNKGYAALAKSIPEKELIMIQNSMLNLLNHGM